MLSFFIIMFSTLIGSSFGSSTYTLRILIGSNFGSSTYTLCIIGSTYKLWTIGLWLMCGGAKLGILIYTLFIIWSWLIGRSISIIGSSVCLIMSTECFLVSTLEVVPYLALYGAPLKLLALYNILVFEFSVNASFCWVSSVENAGRWYIIGLDLISSSFYGTYLFSNWNLYLFSKVCKGLLQYFETVSRDISRTAYIFSSISESFDGLAGLLI